MLEKLGVRSYSSSGASGTVFARDEADGNVRIDVVTSAGIRFSIALEDHSGSLSAKAFSSADFAFA
ncbi:hypothetical protein WG901_22155 [Novosphingobium sp. PS1R-30]|uniref:Uncharacterized protein n=1 Tax=Novosphingobium anseongense TaxID=3133436 RepID=A0ABU8S2B5_9SPHN